MLPDPKPPSRTILVALTTEPSGLRRSTLVDNLRPSSTFVCSFRKAAVARTESGFYPRSEPFWLSAEHHSYAIDG